MDHTDIDKAIQRLESRAAVRKADPARWLVSAVENYLIDQPALLPDPPIDGPLFVYDALKPDELAHPQIAEWVLDSQPAHAMDYALRSRDGFPLLVEAMRAHVDGFLLYFSDARAAYKEVGRFEPNAHYRWKPDGLQVEAGTKIVVANALLARNPNAGADLEHLFAWSSSRDPVFTHGVPVAAAIATPWLVNRSFGIDLGPWQALYQVQAAYLLIWSAVERFTALRFGPAISPVKRLGCLAALPDWNVLLLKAKVPTGERKVVDSRDPGDKIALKEDGSNAWKYWYQVRSNLSHRGKGAHRDLEIVAEAFLDVHDMLRLLLLDLAPGVQDAWRQSDPDGEGRQWRLRPLSVS